jgi:hypothetical protein
MYNNNTAWLIANYSIEAYNSAKMQDSLKHRYQGVNLEIVHLNTWQKEVISSSERT